MFTSSFTFCLKTLLLLNFFHNLYNFFKSYLYISWKNSSVHCCFWETSNLKKQSHALLLLLKVYICYLEIKNFCPFSLTSNVKIMRKNFCSSFFRTCKRFPKSLPKEKKTLMYSFKFSNCLFPLCIINFIIYFTSYC